MNKKAYYGQFGGQYVAESLMNTLQELDQAYEEAIHDPEFMKQYHYYLKQYVGRETPLYYAERLSAKYGTKIYLKREDLNHTGAHKINNVIGQILLAKRMGKTKVIAETGAGQHGVATATGAALFDMECTVYMGKEDIQRQKLNVMRMEMLGAKVVSVESGSNTLKERDKRSHPYLGKNSGGYVLYYRICGRTVSVSEDGERVSECDQPGGKASAHGSRRKESGCGYGMCGRRFQFHRNVCRFY